MFNSYDPYYWYDLELSHEAEAEAHGYESWAEYREAIEDDIANQLQDIRDNN